MNQESSLNTFTTRVRQLILRVEELKDERRALTAAVEEKESEIKALKEQLKGQTEKYNALMMAKMINISDNDIETSKRRISNLIRSVNQCIALLSDNTTGTEDIE